MVLCPPSKDGDLAAPFPSSPPPLSRGHSPGIRCWRCGCPAGAGEPGSPGLFSGGLSSAPLHLASLVTRLLGDPGLLPGCLFSASQRAALPVLTASCYLGFSFFVVGRPGDPSVELHGAATEGGAGPQAGSPAENWPCPGGPRNGPGSGLCLLLVPPLPLPPGGCVLSHVGWAWAGS